MHKTRFELIASIGCAVLFVLLIIAIPMIFFFPIQARFIVQMDEPVELTPAPRAGETQVVIPTLTVPAPPAEPKSIYQTLPAQLAPGIGSTSLTALYERVNPGVVSVQVYIEQGGLSGQGAGSGFILDKEGHIITNNHVVAQAQQITVVFYNEVEAEAEVVGADANSDLAVIRVEQLPEEIHPLPLSDSDQVEVGEWVIAIGNPFGQQSSMSVGIVSAVGRIIPTGVTPFAIPQAIQTDAAINPGNSGGPLLNLQGEVIGVNAQIVTGGPQVNSGVGFAIPANVVRRVAPVLIESGSYQWPWLGVEGGSVNLAIMQANNLESQQGAYIDRVVPDSPAAQAGLQGTSLSRQINGLDVPVGGDVVIEADGQPIADFSDLLAYIALKNPHDQIELTILRNGRSRQIRVELSPRPMNFGP
jgi:2-alkenal reductase